jgi:uncharacterized protein involved in outer membrane biogenesis
MSGGQAPRARIRRILVAAIVGLILFAGAVATLLATADAGLLDRPIERWASHRLGRNVTFKALHLHLLSTEPRMEIDGLSISNPRWMRGGTFADAVHLVATLRRSVLLRGRLEPTSLALDGLTLHLVRFKLGRNNWTFGKPHKGERAFGFLRSTERLTVTRGRLDWLDLQRGLRLRVDVYHDGRGTMPLKLEGQGELNGIPLRLAARSGPLNGTGVDHSYPFVARLVDGGTIVDARGASGDAFNLKRFRLVMDAHGPNLADLGYLFNLRAPNSPPFILATTAEGDGARFLFSPLQIRFGGSDVRGWIRSDHSSGRHRANAELWSGVWTKGDVRAVLAPIPPRMNARSRSGAVPRDSKSRWILPDTAFPIANLRDLDLRALVHIGALRGYPLPLNHVSARIDLDDGTLTYSSVRGEVYGGSLSGTATLDVHRPRPRLSVDGAITGLQLARLQARSARLAGALAVAIKLTGVGRSVHEAASTASGDAMVRITHGSVPPAAALMLGGDALKALRSVGDVRRPIALDCVSARFKAVGGLLRTDDLAIKTVAGDTTGQGMLNLGEERLRFTLHGTPKQNRPFQLAMPVLIDGSIMQPKVSLLPTRNATKLGLEGKIGVILSPLAALLPMGKQAPAIARCI